MTTPSRARAAALSLLTTGLVAAAALGPPSAASTVPAERAAPHSSPRDSAAHGKEKPHRKPGTVRFATFNASLNRGAAGELVDDLSTRDDGQAAAVAEIIQRTRPDVLLLNEFDYDPGHRAIDLFRDNYLEVGQHGARPIRYRYAYVAPSNTGVPSGHDLDNDGTVGGPNDAYGFGEFPGQYGMAVLSRYPIDREQLRTFQTFRWQDMPGALLPDDPATPEPADWYSPAELEDVRLSSKSHWDLPIRVGRRTVHFLVSHPTPPTFDGPEDRNGRRNHDEIRFWADYVAGGKRARYIYDDQGRRGGLPRRARFVIAGDQNADPNDGDSTSAAIDQLLDHPRIEDPRPTSAGGPEASARQGGANARHEGDPAYDTADFADALPGGPGNLRVDYVLPARRMKVRDAGVFWPTSDDPLSRLTGEYPFPSSDHRAVWVDVRP